MQHDFDFFCHTSVASLQKKKDCKGCSMGLSSAWLTVMFMAGGSPEKNDFHPKIGNETDKKVMGPKKGAKPRL